LVVVAVAIQLNPDYVRALLRRAELHEQTDKLDEALEDFKKVLDLDPVHSSARQACLVRGLDPSVSSRLSLPVCLFPSVSSRLSLPVCLYPSVSTRLSLPVCLYPSVSSRLSLTVCISLAVALYLSVSNSLYLSFSQRLPQQIQERNEKLKEEMMSMFTSCLSIFTIKAPVKS